MDGRIEFQSGPGSDMQDPRFSQDVSGILDLGPGRGWKFNP